jgi:hypothetical protein
VLNQSNRIERHLRNQYLRHLPEGSGVFNPLVGQVHLTEQIIEVAEILTAGTNHRDVLARFLLREEADWDVVDGFSIGDEAADQFDSLPDRLAEQADQYRLLTPEALAFVVGDLFSSESDRNVYLTQTGLIEICGFWGLKDVQQVRIAAALKAIGRPATKAEIGEVAGLTESQVVSQTSVLPNVVRADMIRWGFEEWVDDVYDGIAGEIEQRIDQHNDEVPLDTLIAEIQQFGVTERSIRMYVETDAYLNVDGMVRRNPTNYKPRPISQRNDVVWNGESCGQRLQLEDRHFNGYSLLVSFDVAYRNGIRPLDSLLVPFEGSEGVEASIIWRPINTARTVDVGRLSGALKHAGFVPGDSVVIYATPDAVSVVGGSDNAQTGEESESSGLADFLSLFEGDGDVD